MSQYVDLTLDRPRRFRLTPIDVRNVCRYLNGIDGYATGLGGPVTGNALLRLLAGRDFDCYAAVLSAGLQHEDKSLNTDKAMRLLTDYLGNGGSLLPVSTAIIQAGIAAGVWERSETAQDEAAPRGNADGAPALS